MSTLTEMLATHCQTQTIFFRELAIAEALGPVEHAICLKYGILPSELIGGLLTATRKSD